MKLINSIKEFFKNFFLLERFDFDNIVIKKDVVDDIIEFARINHPREFIMYLEGKIRKKVLIIDGLLYQEYVSNRTSATSKVNFPIGLKIVGSVHSHPGSSAKPSKADLKSFLKNGLVHLIIKEPYFKEDIAVYLANGQATTIKII